MWPLLTLISAANLLYILHPNYVHVNHASTNVTPSTNNASANKVQLNHFFSVKSGSYVALWLQAYKCFG